MEPNYTDLELYKAKLRKAHQEAQQWEDETDLEVETLHDIIDNQQDTIAGLQIRMGYDYTKQQSIIEAYKLELEHLRSQLNAAYERNLKQGFAVDAAKQEVAEWKHSHSDACEMNRRLCLDLQITENTVNILRHERDAAQKEAADARRSNNCLLDQLQAAEAINQWYEQRFCSISQLEKLREKVDEKLRTGKPVDYRDLILTGIDTYKPRI